MRAAHTVDSGEGTPPGAAPAPGPVHPELLRALGSLAEEPRPAHGPITAAVGLPPPPTVQEFTSVLVLQCHPYAAVHLGPEGMLGGEGADRVAGFWRALGLAPPVEPDHLGTLLAMYATLGEAQVAEGEPARAAGMARAREALLWEHLWCWVPPFLGAVADTGSAWYGAWAALVGEALEAEVGAARRPATLPLALRAAPEPPDAGARVEEVIEAVLAPVRSGMVLTWARLVVGARQLGLGLRQGERRFALQAMADQDPRGTLSWLSREAARWAERHRARGQGAEAEWWANRAATSAAALAALAQRPAAR